MTVELSNPHGHVAVPLHHHMASATATGTKHVHIAGQVLWDESGQLVARGDLGGPVAQVYRNVARSLNRSAHRHRLTAARRYPITNEGVRMRWRAMVRTDLFRVLVSGAVAALVAMSVVITLVLLADIGSGDPTELLVTSYVVVWPVYTLLYVAWSFRVYSNLDSVSLWRMSAAEGRDERRPLQRFLGVTGATNTTISAAVVAVIVTVAIAQRPEFRSEGIYIVMTLLTVASSWVLMVFSFAQSYLRLGTGNAVRPHLVFHFPGTARFSDYFTLAVLVSTMAVTLSADVGSRKGWRVLRTNVVIAFVFNSVIIAMMVSLLFGGLLG